MRKRRKFTPESKARVALEVLTGMKTNAEVCREYGLKDGLLATWKKTFLEPSLSGVPER